MTTFLSNIQAVCDGKRSPAGSSADYAREILWWTSEGRDDIRPGELPHEVFERLARERCPVLRALRVAGGIARMFEGNCDPRPLLDALGLVSGSDEYSMRLYTWADLVSLVAPHCREGEPVGAALRRLVESNSAARCAFIFAIAEPR